MIKQTVTGELTLVNENQHFEEIELKEEGYLKIIVNQDNPNFNTITINRLINSKDNPLSHPYDIYVTSENGKSAPPDSGSNGDHAKNGGEFNIIVKDLVKDIKVYVQGGKGGNGGSGKTISSKLGGNGGNGGNAPKVSFYYSHTGISSGIPHPYREEEALGGTGGNGGNGAFCSEPMGTGETPTTKPSVGGKNGDGGKKGTNGEKGFLKFYDTTQSIKPMNLNIEEEYNYFIDIFGGEETLKKYPKIWNSIQTKKSKKNLQNNTECGLHFITKGSNASLIAAEINRKKSNQNDSGFVKVRINNVMNVVNMTQFDSQGTYIPPLSDFTTCTRIIDIIENINGVDHVIKRFTPGQFERCYQISDTFDTEDYSASSLANKHLKIRTTYTFSTSDDIIPITFTTKIDNATANIDTFYKRLTLTEPHYHHDGKTSGNIRILYGRIPSPNLPEYSDSDYYGNNEFGNFENNRDPLDGKLHSIPTTILPIAGTIHFNNCTMGKIDNLEILDYVIWDKEKKIMEFSKPILSLSDDTSNMIVEMGANEIDPKDSKDDLAKHLISAGSFTPHIDPENDYKTTLDFDLHLRKEGNYTNYGKCDWISKIESAFYSNESIHANTCFLIGSLRVKVDYHNGNDKKSTEIDINFQSISENNIKKSNHKYFETEDYYSTVYLPILIICWGCYAADTLITTTEGRKKANEIKRGDKLPTYSGKILTVSQVYVGEDKYICNIKTIDNKSIRVSCDHAMKLYCENKPDGRKISARNIKKGDILMTANGNVEVASAEIEAYNDKVYNFVFEEEVTPNYIEANGFWSGDFNAQNEPEKRELTPEQKAICAEWKQLAAELIQKRKEESSST